MVHFLDVFIRWASIVMAVGLFVLALGLGAWAVRGVWFDLIAPEVRSARAMRSHRRAMAALGSRKPPRRPQ